MEERKDKKIVMKVMRETKMRAIRFKLSGMVSLKTEKELVLKKESTMRISTKRKGVCGTHERRREGENDDNKRYIL